MFMYMYTTHKTVGKQKVVFVVSRNHISFLFKLFLLFLIIKLSKMRKNHKNLIFFMRREAVVKKQLIDILTLEVGDLLRDCNHHFLIY